MDWTLYLGLSAGVVQLIGFGIYNRQVFLGNAVPNTTTWTLWAFLTVIAASSYVVISEDVAKYVLLVATASANIGTFVYALIAGKFRRIDPWDGFVLAVGIIAGLVWWWYQSAAYAQVLITVAVALAFIPLSRAVWKSPRVETVLPWMVWATAYGLMSLVTILRWSGNPLELLYPATMLVLHLMVGVLARRSR